MTSRDHTTFEQHNKILNDDTARAAYAAEHDGYRPALLPRLLGSFLILSGNVIYGKEPSYLKFRAVEIIARVPYHSWDSAAYTLMTFFFFDEQRALSLAHTSRFARFAQDNETMHIVVISRLAVFYEKIGLIRGSLIPLWFAFFYFWWSYTLYFINNRWSYELNFLFEQHAYDQYSRFLELEEEALRSRDVPSDYLAWYGRTPADQYEFFRSIRNDELIHRNESIEAIAAEKARRAAKGGKK